MKRRNFLLSISATTFTAASYARLRGANDRFGMALVGSGRHRSPVFTLASVWELPLGQDRRFLSNAGGAADAVLGGWQFNVIYSLQT